MPDTSTPTVPETAAARRAAPGPASAGEVQLAYRLLTGADDRGFCERVSAALAEGYVLHGSPAATFNGSTVIVAQALVLPASLASAVSAAGEFGAHGFGDDEFGAHEFERRA